MSILMDYGVVEDGRQSIISLYKSLEEKLDTLSHALAAIDAEWTGEAGDAFRESYQKWLLAASELQEDLAFIHQLVCNGQTNFAAADAAVAMTWQAGA